MPLPGRSPFALPLSLVGGTIDRGAQHRSDDQWLRAATSDPNARVMQVAGGRCSPWTPPDEVRCDPATWYFLGLDQAGVPYFAAPAAEADRAWKSLRDNAGELMQDDATLLATAVALNNWHTTHPRCPQCGGPAIQAHGGWIRRCPADGSEHYPRTDPAVIMTVTDPDERLLLGHAAAWPERRFSTLAGFVEPGESFEAAVRREVLEEVGIHVGQVTYLASQPWPFPASLMIGCDAQALDTQIAVDADEVTQARWFTREELARDVRDGTVICPRSSSISRRLIERWFGGDLPDGPESWA